MLYIILLIYLYYIIMSCESNVLQSTHRQLWPELFNLFCICAFKFPMVHLYGLMCNSFFHIPCPCILHKYLDTYAKPASYLLQAPPVAKAEEFDVFFNWEISMLLGVKLFKSVNISISFTHTITKTSIDWPLNRIDVFIISIISIFSQSINK